MRALGIDRLLLICYSLHAYTCAGTPGLFYKEGRTKQRLPLLNAGSVDLETGKFKYRNQINDNQEVAPIPPPSGIYPTHLTAFTPAYKAAVEKGNSMRQRESQGRDSVSPEREIGDPPTLVDEGEILVDEGEPEESFIEVADAIRAIIGRTPAKDYVLYTAEEPDGEVTETQETRIAVSATDRVAVYQDRRALHQKSRENFENGEARIYISQIWRALQKDNPNAGKLEIIVWDVPIWGTRRNSMAIFPHLRKEFGLPGVQNRRYPDSPSRHLRLSRNDPHSKVRDAFDAMYGQPGAQEVKKAVQENIDVFGGNVEITHVHIFSKLRPIVFIIGPII
ncbi:hypothetical protein ABW19_dt0205306 [Dactylella cylindrospora]|nr:hypothetical protein ABW19_dt0205306 [Dactylella cylindrospora]